jgi:hypothetical protein
VTLAPPLGAAADNVTVQVDVPPDTTLAGEHPRPLTVTAGGITVTVVAAEPPFSDAVTATPWFAVTVPAVTTNVPVVAPATTVAEAGVVNAVLLSESVTLAPPLGAAADNVTVQVDVPPDTTLLGEHPRPETTGSTTAWTEILPPVPVTARLVPSAKDPRTPFSDSGTVLPAVVASWTPTTATTPLPIRLLFMPVARHVTVPVPELHTTLLPAAVDAAPVDTVIDAMSVEE